MLIYIWHIWIYLKYYTLASNFVLTPAAQDNAGGQLSAVVRDRSTGFAPFCPLLPQGGTQALSSVTQAYQASKEQETTQAANKISIDHEMAGIPSPAGSELVNLNKRS